MWVCLLIHNFFGNHQIVGVSFIDGIAKANAWCEKITYLLLLRTSQIRWVISLAFKQQFLTL
ncbi:hypothetical protein D1839_05035 [Roseburia sp. 1XD42-34]|nr:hypothetical protein [Roseburia sp. 1XD42-34]RKI80217.1 hypothetical protein D7V87_05025 [Clostridium sp. 1xD42-85]